MVISLKIVKPELASPKEHHSYLGSLLHMQIPGPTPEIPIQCAWVGAEDAACLRSLLVVVFWQTGSGIGQGAQGNSRVPIRK